MEGAGLTRVRSAVLIRRPPRPRRPSTAASCGPLPLPPPRPAAASSAFWNSLTTATALSGVSLPWARSLIMTTGAIPHAPTQCTSSTVKSMSSRVLPGVDAQVALDLLGDERSARDVTGRAVTTPDGVLGVGFQAELGIERGDPESHAERLAGRLRHPGHHVLGQPPENGLGSLQKGDQAPPSPLCNGPAVR